MSLSGIVLCCCTPSSFYTSPHWELRAYRPHSIWRAFGSFFLFFNCTIVRRFWLDRYNIRERCGKMSSSSHIELWELRQRGGEKGWKSPGRNLRELWVIQSLAVIERICVEHIHREILFPFFFISFSSPFILIYSSRSRLDIGLVDGLDLKGWISTEAKKNLFVTFVPVCAL